MEFRRFMESLPHCHGIRQISAGEQTHLARSSSRTVGDFDRRVHDVACADDFLSTQSPHLAPAWGLMYVLLGWRSQADTLVVVHVTLPSA